MKVAVAQRMAQEYDTGVRVNVEYAAALAKRAAPPTAEGTSAASVSLPTPIYITEPP